MEKFSLIVFRDFNSTLKDAAHLLGSQGALIMRFYILQHLPFAIWVVDRKPQFVFLNSYFPRGSRALV